MPAPSEPLKAPYPNLIIPGFPRTAMHVITVTGANGSAALNASKSSQAVTVTYVSEGLYTLTFPAGGTGAVGFCLPGIAEGAAPGTAATATECAGVVSGTVSYVTGTVQVQFWDKAATAAVADHIGDFTICVFVVLGPQGAI